MKKTRSWADISTLSILLAPYLISKDMVSLRSLESFQGLQRHFPLLIWLHKNLGTKPCGAIIPLSLPSTSGNHLYFTQDFILYSPQQPCQQHLRSQDGNICINLSSERLHCKEELQCTAHLNLKVREEWSLNSTDTDKYSSCIFLLFLSAKAADQMQGEDLLSKCHFHIVTLQSWTAFLSVAVSLFTVRLNPYPWCFLLFFTDCQHWGQE